MNEKKSLTLTYIFALIGGFFGLHHLYLGRVQHAFLWLTTFGGCGVGFFYEFLFSIRKYVHEANRSPLVIKQYQMQMIQRKSPSFELVRFCGQYLTAVFYGFLTYYAFPETYHNNSLLSMLIGCSGAFAIAIGTQLTGTIGPRRCSFLWPLLGAILGIPFLIQRTEFSPSFNISALLSSCIFEWKVEWDRTYFSNIPLEKSDQSTSPKIIKRKTNHSMKRYAAFVFAAIVFSGIFTSAVYQNLQVDIKGRRVRIKDVIKDFFRSQEFILICEQLANIARELWRFYLKYGFKGIWAQIWMSIDSKSVRNAYQTLQLQYDAPQHQIESQCRTLSRQWHPDRYRNVEDKQKAQTNFINIQQACDRLSNERKRRHSLHTQM